MDLFARLNSYRLESLYHYQHVMRLRSIDFIWYAHPTIDLFPLPPTPVK